MNGRIKQLYEQSLIRETVKDHAGNPMLVIKQDPEKFAELIVRECMEINLTLLGHNTCKNLHNLYEEHFGVEE